MGRRKRERKLARGAAAEADRQRKFGWFLGPPEDGDDPADAPRRGARQPSARAGCDGGDPGPLREQFLAGARPP
jgi:hypothetical protein